MSNLLISKREWSRAWEIVRIAGHYGFASLAQAIGLGRLVGVRRWRRTGRGVQALPAPVRLRLALSELGTTFIKLGQVLSVRSDMLPPEYVTELSRLQDRVPAVSYTEIEPVFVEELGKLPTEIFAEFSIIPIASASIGQVYEAELSDGSQVMVKVQRPGVMEQVNTDLSLMHRMAELANRVEQLKRFDFPALVNEFQYILQDELNYTIEGYNAERLAEETADPDIVFPRVYWPATTRRVLTTYRIEGIKVTDDRSLAQSGINRHNAATALANSILRQFLQHGLFHGDPHPGNVLILRDGRVALLDTGMVGRLDRKTRQLLIELSLAIFEQDVDAVMGHLQQIGVVQDATELPALRRDVSRLLTKYYFLPRKLFRLGELLQRMNYLLFMHRIRMAYEFSLVIKALVMVEGIAQDLDPDFDYNAAAQQVIEELRQEYYSPELLVKDTERELRGLRRQIVDLPQRLNTVLSHLESGTMRVITHDDSWLDKQLTQQQTANRISLAVLSVGLLLASALILASHPIGWLHYLAITGTVAGSVFVVALLVSIVKSTRD